MLCVTNQSCFSDDKIEREAVPSVDQRQWNVTGLEREAAVLCAFNLQDLLLRPLAH